eukprot:2449919-Pleurochrysis_carterae.AAC.1
MAENAMQSASSVHTGFERVSMGSRVRLRATMRMCVCIRAHCESIFSCIRTYSPLPLLQPPVGQSLSAL